MKIGYFPMFVFVGQFPVFIFVGYFPMVTFACRTGLKVYKENVSISK